jgi:hypothetical protein
MTCIFKALNYTRKMFIKSTTEIGFYQSDFFVSIQNNGWTHGWNWASTRVNLNQNLAQHIRHLCLEPTILSCYRCLIFNSVNEHLCIIRKFSHLATSQLVLSICSKNPPLLDHLVLQYKTPVLAPSKLTNQETAWSQFLNTILTFLRSWVWTL